MYEKLQDLIARDRGKEEVFIVYEYEVDDGDGHFDKMESSCEPEMVDGRNCIYIQKKEK